MRPLPTSRATAFLSCLLALSTSAAERIWPDPFQTCAPVSVAIRPPDDGLAVEQVTYDLQASVRINAPAKLLLYSNDNLVPPTVELGFGANRCYYKRFATSYDLDHCSLPVAPEGYAAKEIVAVVPGLHRYARTGLTVLAEFPRVMPCGRPTFSGKFFQRPSAVPNLWNVVLDEIHVNQAEVALVAESLTQQFGGAVVSTFLTPRGFVLSASSTKASAISTDWRVRFVESVVEVRGLGIRDTSIPLSANSARFQWAHDRLDQPLRDGTDSSFRWPTPQLGASLLPRVWIVDTAVRTTHVAFAGLPFQSINATSRAGCLLPDPNVARSSHGTEVASALVGYLGTGQMAAAEVYFVRALGRKGVPQLCDGGDSTEVEAALRQIAPAVRERDIINLSIGVPPTATFEMIILDLLARGAVVVAAAGNSGMPVSEAPANIPGVIAIGALAEQTTAPAYAPEVALASSSYGPLVSFWAPGENVLAALDTADNAYTGSGGTSIAAPLAAGIALHLAATIPPAGGGTHVEVRRLMNRDGASSGGLSLALLRAPPVPFGLASLPSSLTGESLNGVVFASGALWVGRASPTASGVSLARIPFENGAPSLAKIQVLRSGAESCRPMTEIRGQATSGTIGVSVVCQRGDGKLRIVSYDDSGLANPYEGQYGDSSYSPVAGASDQDLTPTLDVAALAFDRAGGEKVSVFLVAGPYQQPLQELQIDHTIPGAWVRVKSVAVNCDRQPGNCDAYILVDQSPSFPSTVWEASVHRITFSVSSSPGGGTVVAVSQQAQVAALSRTIDPASMCGVPGAAFGVGLSGLAVVADDRSFKWAVGVSVTADLGSGCQYAGQTITFDPIAGETSRTPVGTLMSSFGGSRITKTSAFVGFAVSSDGMTASPTMVSNTRGLQIRSRPVVFSAVSAPFVAVEGSDFAILQHSGSYDWQVRWGAL